MVSFRTTLLAVAAATSVSGYWVEPSTIPMMIRTAWCNDQKSSCGPICLETSTGPPQINDCDPETLHYGCLCSDGKQPNMSEYSLTIPYHVCTAWGTKCVADCGSDNLCSSACRQDNPCGAQNPQRVNVTTTTSTSASATAAPTGGVVDGMADDGEDGNGSGGGSSAAGMLRFGDSYGLAVVAGGLFAGFAMLL